MNTDKSKATSLICVHLCSSVVGVLLLFSGCGKPSAANITVRKENQELREKVDQLERARLADAATIRALEQQKGTLPTLPNDRLERLFTTHRIEVARLSGGGKVKHDSPGDDCIKVHVEPVDQTGDAIKAAGSVVIEAFDLNDPEHRQIGHWEFSNDDLRKSWVATFLMNEYVLTCPLREPPKHPQITVNATFNDELTQRTFTAQRAVTITLPPAPASSPTTMPVSER